ncbi:hypothetical protein FRC06_001342 [Ceratobasidium sp. 370]|nr:hypothetical protein FRC06_001342 [Ceratobasidium sp. 370]
MAWNRNHGASGWQTGSNDQSSFYPDGSGNRMQPHYANAFYAPGGYYAQPAVPQLAQITIPAPGFARNQPMASLVPIHMRNRVGPVRCGHEGCLFAGSPKEVEVHKMDRHLIFPPGWEENQARKKRKRGREKEGGEEEYVDEEAQFRATGTVAILGTDTKLDSPEAITAWLEERKKRWPSVKRIAEKAQNRQEALERGQIITEPQAPRRLNTGSDNGSGASSQRGRGRGRGRGRESMRCTPGPEEGGNRVTDKSWCSRARGRGRGVGLGNVTGGRGRGRGHGGTHPVPPAQAPSSSKQDASYVSTSGSSTSTGSSLASDSDSSTGSDSGDGSESDMDPVRDAVSSKVAPVEEMHMDVEPVGGNEREPAENINQLLVPDIQATVSNLSQAIRFLVANNFLEDVELKPGDAEIVPVQPVVTRLTE